MGTGVIIAANVAARQREAEERLTGKLLARDAVSAERATVVAPEGAEEARALVRLLDGGVVREAGGGRFWIDRSAIESGFGGNAKVALLTVALALLVVMAVLVLVLTREQRRAGETGDRWRSYPPTAEGAALVYSGRRRVEWEIRCRASPTDLMVVTTARPRRRATEIRMEVDGQTLPLQIERDDGQAGVTAFGPVTPAMLEAMRDGAEVRMRYGNSRRRLRELPPAQGAAFADACARLQVGPLP